MHRITLLLWPFLLFAQPAPNGSSPTLEDAHLALVRGDVASAEASVRNYLLAHKDSADAHFLLGYILFKKQDAKGSLAEYTEGARYRRPGPYDLEAVGCDYVLLKDYPDADKWLSKAVEWDASNLSALYYLGRTKYNENRFEEAVAVFQKCLTRDPKNVKYADNLGLSYQGLGRNDEAAAAFHDALDWDRSTTTSNPGPYLDFGTLLLDSGRTDEAIPLLTRAVQLAPRELRAHTQLGKAYLHNGLLDKAQLELERAVQLDPDSAPAHFVLAQIYKRRGFADKARLESAKYRTLSGEHSTDKGSQ